MATAFKDLSAVPWIFKDPESLLDYQVDWATWLVTDTISSVVWAVPTGITQDSVSTTTTKATIWLSGGTVAIDYTIECKILTAAGRTDERRFVVKVRER